MPLAVLFHFFVVAFGWDVDKRYPFTPLLKLFFPPKDVKKSRLLTITNQNSGSNIHQLIVTHIKV